MGVIFILKENHRDEIQKRKRTLEKIRSQKVRTKKLTPAQKAKTKASAKKAGRPYPNLVDNMKVAKKKKKSS